MQLHLNVKITLIRNSKIVLASFEFSKCQQRPNLKQKSFDKKMNVAYLYIVQVNVKRATVYCSIH